MRKKLSVGVVILAFVVGTTGATFGAIITFDGGIATLTDGTTVVTSDTTTHGSFNPPGVDYYQEDGFTIDFVNGEGIIGNYYDDYYGGSNTNAVIHAHDFSVIDIVFSKDDGSAFDLTYVDMTSNTQSGGGVASGFEDSYITTSGGYSLLLAPSDWGIDFLSDGATASDGIVRNWMDSNFEGITSFTLSSTNAYCFGMDNFYIDEAPPVPVPGAVLLGILGLSVAGVKLRRKEG